MTVKHATASTFVFARLAGCWRLGLIVHPLFGKLMIPGGHVEPHESAPEAAVREVAEETGLSVALAGGPAAAVPAGLSDHRRAVALPWWILEQPIDSDNHLPEPHWHVDHLFVGLARSGGRAGLPARPAHPFGWYGAGELAGLDMFADTRILAEVLFPDIVRIAAIAESGGGEIH